MLLGPVSNRPQKRFIVVAHDRLQALPFDALVMPDQRFLAETHIVTYSPSATILAELRAGGETHLKTACWASAPCPTPLQRRSQARFTL